MQHSKGTASRVVGALIGTTTRLSVLAVLLASNAVADEVIEELVVTTSRAPTYLRDQPGNIATLGDDAIELTAHAHIHELLTRVPGVWVSRGSGQESLPSIRSPVLTGAGSCGAFLTLENGIPTRPSGFCNVNQLFELPTEFSESREIVRGPGNALYGSNSMHGAINVLAPMPSTGSRTTAKLELGPNDFFRVGGLINSGDGAQAVIGGSYTDDGGFRDASGYRQVKALFRKNLSVSRGDLLLNVSLSDLDQDTAGFILGKDAYKDDSLNRSNPNPEAFRQASSQRANLEWRHAYGDFDVDIRPYLRHSEMTFLQHFLPGQPVEENGHVSAGFMANARLEGESRTLSFGIDADVADVYLRETQFGPTEGSAFLRETRPEGKHYDYDVLGLNVAAYLQAEFQLSPAVAIHGGLRAEYSHYDYDNNMLSGNTRDDGSACGFGGCLYTRPADRTDHYFDVAPNLGLAYTASDSTTLFLNVARGFRAPQMTELYRLQNGQAVSDLDSETIDSAEVGIRMATGRWDIETSVYTMRKTNSVIRDADGFNVSAAKSEHDGIELSVDVDLHDYWSLTINGAFAKHVYDFDSVAARGETFVSGNDIDTAPRWLGSAALNYEGPGRLVGELQWVSQGSYYLDAENRYTYPGHDIANIRLRYLMSEYWSTTVRMNNILDNAYADRADFAFGNYRYFPGRGRELFVEIRYSK